MKDFARSPATIRIGDLEVSRIGYGAMQIPGPMVWGEPADPARIRKVLRMVVDLGIQLIDTSWYYGPHVSNRFIQESLFPYPKDLVIATKLGGKRGPDKSWLPFLRPEELREGCDEDLRGLRLERVDVAHLRWIDDANVPFSESLDAMIELKAEGKIRHLALSNVSLEQLEQALAKTPIVGVQNMYNVAASEKRLGAIPHMRIAGQERMVDFCAERGIAFLPFFPLAIPGAPKRATPTISAVARRHGKTEAQIAIAWLLARSPALLPIAGTSSPEHLQENWDARQIALTDADVAEITAARDAL